MIRFICVSKDKDNNRILNYIDTRKGGAKRAATRLGTGLALRLPPAYLRPGYLAGKPYDPERDHY